MTLQLGILASGSGTNAQTIFEAIDKGILDADIRLVFSNQCDAKVLDRAKKFNIPHFCLDHKNFFTREEFDKKMCAVLKEHGAETIAMAGYMRLVTPYFLNEFSHQVLNIHPAILPSFAGVHGARDAVEYGVKVSGCSVHFVSEVMDTGPLIIQAVVPNSHLDTEDTLQARIHEVEHKIYIQALQWLAENRLVIKGRVVHLLPSKKHTNLQTSLLRASFLGLENKIPRASCQETSSSNPFELGALIYPPLEENFL